MPINTIRCCIEADQAYRPKARYTITTLLRPLNLEPNWVDRSELGSSGLYYGPESGSLAKSVVTIRLGQSTESYFGSRDPLKDASNSFDENGLLRLFPVEGHSAPSDEGWTFSWDPVASAFFFLSGWQEWVEPRRDVHGRYPFSESIQSRLGITHEPMVDRYRSLLRKHLENAGWVIERRTWGDKPAAVCITHDIDYHKKWRPGILYGETTRHLIKGGAGGRLNGAVRLFGALWAALVDGDPFRRSADRMLATEVKHGMHATWFFKAGAHSRHDVAYSLERGWIKKLIDRLHGTAQEVGLHPSYDAADNRVHLHNEASRLRAASKRSEVTSIRSHYLRWIGFDTARAYSESQFTIDSTLGFAEHEGFRNATVTPFQLFDIETNTVLPIWEFPLAVMDTTLYGYRDLDTQEGIDATVRLLDVVREFGGVLVLLWHNILDDELGNPRLSPHFHAMIERFADTDVLMCSLREGLESWLQSESSNT